MTSEKLISLRKDLHRHPELSGQETETAGRIKQFIREGYDGPIIENLGGTGLAVIHEFSKTGPTVVIRCELDALPIQEENPFEHRSVYPGVSHKCGHDGHVTIVAGLSSWLNNQAFSRGKVMLLFQPAEETGAGAAAVLNDPRFTELKPDYIFALHNIPGQPLHSIILVEGNYSCTVISTAIRLKGKESHSSEPEHGINPALCLAELTQKLDALNKNDPASADFRLCVPVYSSMGVKSYGISAGFGEIHYTLRTRNVPGMEALRKEVDTILSEVCPKHNLAYTTDFFEYFPAVLNDEFCNQTIAGAAQKNGYTIVHKNAPYRFGEDFGWFSDTCKAAMFGLGAGLQSAALHQAHYDFPDELIESGITMFKGIIETLLA
jgi:amidohydrolase